MALAKPLVRVSRRTRKAAKILLQRQLAAALWRYLFEVAAALPDRGAKLDDLPPEFFRFPPF
jgi:hypothetical protein